MNIGKIPTKTILVYFDAHAQIHIRVWRLRDRMTYDDRYDFRFQRGNVIMIVGIDFIFHVALKKNEYNRFRSPNMSDQFTQWAGTSMNWKMIWFCCCIQRDFVYFNIVWYTYCAINARDEWTDSDYPRDYQ